MDLADFREQLEKFAIKTGRTKGVKANQIGSAVGSPGQSMQERIRNLFSLVLPDEDLSRLVIMDVGDSARKFGFASNADEYSVETSLPVASDIWYLAIGASILPFNGENYQENSQRALDSIAWLRLFLDDISPLKSLQKYEDLQSIYVWQKGGAVWQESKAPFVIREARYETWMLNRNTEFPSKGPAASGEDGIRSKPETSMGQLYAGMLSFPVGPLGVEEVLSIFSESMIEMLQNNIPFTPDATVKIEFPEGWHCIRERALEGLMSPMTDMKNECPGVHLVEGGYLMSSRDAEYPAEPFKGYDAILPFHSMRYYLRRDAKWPLPGEFIGLLAKPFPTHVWWFQETSPLLYAGNWVETNHYTSGVVTEILQPQEGAFGLVCKCIVRGVDICIASSDFYGYAVGDRVAIIRLNDLGRFMDKTRGNFKWEEMEDLFAWEKAERETPSNLPYVVNPNMMIVPMSFYKP